MKTTNGFAKIYEIIVNNQPTFKRTDVLPKLTKLEMEAGYQNINIEYFPSAEKKLYSYDKENWNEYIEPLKSIDNPSKVTTIYAKSIDSYGRESKVGSITLECGSESLCAKGYDGNSDSYYSVNIDRHNKFKIDSIMVGKSITVKASNGYYIYIYAINKDGSQSTIKSYNSASKGIHTDTFTIPSGTEYIDIYGLQGSGSSISVYEVIVNDQPTFKRTDILPILKNSGMEAGYQNINIEYFPSAEKKLYSYDKENWNEYTEPLKSIDNPSKVTTIYAKSIDSNGKESKVGSITLDCGLESLCAKGYDGDLNSYYTYSTNRHSKFKIDSSMIGKSITVKASNGYYLYIYAISNTGTQSTIKSYNSASKGIHTDTFTIPSGTEYIDIYGLQGTGSSISVYEVKINN